MEIVIDAQIINAYFKEEVKEKPSKDLTDSASKVMQRLGKEDRVNLDNEDHIAKEWRQVVEPEWFDAWYSNLLQTGAARVLPVDSYSSLRKKLEKVGFPTKGPGGRDFWYIRVAKAVVDSKISDSCYLISEDMDFHHPKLKRRARGKTRLRILHNPKSPVKKVLSKENIFVHCISTYLKSVE